MMLRLETKNILNYEFGRKRNPGTLRRHYRNWRLKNNIPDRCDIEECVYHTKELIWNGSVLGLILDHIDGCSNNNNPNNLRFVCPNCNSQLPTAAGKNKGRIQNQSETAYQVNRKEEDKLDLKLFPKTAHIKLSLG